MFNMIISEYNCMHSYVCLLVDIRIYMQISWLFTCIRGHG